MTVKYKILRDKNDMNNRELENYFHLFLGKDLIVYIFCINKRVN